MNKPKRHGRSRNTSVDDLIVGLHALGSVLTQRGEDVLELFVQRERDDARVQAILEQAHASGITPQFVPREALDRLSDGARHQGVVARCRPAPEITLDAVLQKLSVESADLLVLDGVSDPHNLGACLRSAAAAAVAALIVPKSRAAPLTPITRRIASGGAELIPVCSVANLARALRQISDFGMPVVGLAGDTTTALFDLDLRAPTALVIGTEASGLRRLTREHCDQVAKIPMPGAMESLNMSVATGIALFEMQRQRRVT
jgi:23S rRNA (guanosine2251-2'-O)-methyltransferase